MYVCIHACANAICESSAERKRIGPLKYPASLSTANHSTRIEFQTLMFENKSFLTENSQNNTANTHSYGGTFWITKSLKQFDIIYLQLCDILLGEAMPFHYIRICTKHCMHTAYSVQCVIGSFPLMPWRTQK